MKSTLCRALPFFALVSLASAEPVAGGEDVPLESAEPGYSGVTLSIRAGSNRIKGFSKGDKADEGFVSQGELSIPLGYGPLDFCLRGYYKYVDPEDSPKDAEVYQQGGGSAELLLHFLRGRVVDPYVSVGCLWDGREDEYESRETYTQSHTRKTWVPGHYEYSYWWYTWVPGHYKTSTYKTKEWRTVQHDERESDDTFIARVGMNVNQNWFHARLELSYASNLYDCDDLLTWSALLGADLCSWCRFDIAGDYTDENHELSGMAGFTFTFGASSGSRDPGVTEPGPGVTEPEPQSLQERYVRWQGKRAPVEMIKSKIPAPPIAALIDVVAVIPGTIYVPCANASDTAFARNVGREIYLAAIEDVKAGKSLDEIFADKAEDRKAFTDYAHYVMGVDYAAEEAKDAEDEAKLNEAQTKLSETMNMDIAGMVKGLMPEKPSLSAKELMSAEGRAAMKAYKDKVAEISSIPTQFTKELGQVGSQITDTFRALNYKRLLNKQDREAQQYLKEFPVEQ